MSTIDTRHTFDVISPQCKKAAMEHLPNTEGRAIACATCPGACDHDCHVVKQEAMEQHMRELNKEWMDSACEYCGITRRRHHESDESEEGTVDLDYAWAGLDVEHEL